MNIRALLIALAIAGQPASAFAQSTAQPVTPGYLTTTGCPSGYTSCFKPYGATIPIGPGTLPISTIPPRLTAYGTLAVTAASVALSTLTVGPNSPAWTTTYPSNYVSIRNSVNSAGVAYFCPLGGTCSASVGEPIAVGETIFRNVANATAITLFSTAGATVIAEE